MTYTDLILAAPLAAGAGRGIALILMGHRGAGALLASALGLATVLIGH